MENKRGQFYLMAAIVIILIIVGLAVVPNDLRKVGTDNSKIYELFAEVNIDNQKMMGYDTNAIESYEKNDLKNILGNMTDIYPSIDIIYILIKRNTASNPVISFYTYENEKIIGGKIGNLEVDIDGTAYTFPSEDNNFYYLIIQEKNEQQYVIKG